MVKVQKGDVIRLHYTGKVRETGGIFDTTSEEVAKEAGIYKEDGTYGPVPIAVGAGHVLKGLDEQLEGLDVGGKYEIIVPPEKGFGKRDPKLIKTFTLGQFRREGLHPFPGMDIEVDTHEGRKLRGRVLSVSSGRVRVDFNSPLAGKHLIYEVEILEKVEDPIEKVKALLELRMPKVDRDKVIIEVGEKDVTIDFTPIQEEVDKNTLVLGELVLESDLKFIGYEKTEFKPSVDELLKPPVEEGEEEKGVVEVEEEVNESPAEKDEIGEGTGEKAAEEPKKKGENAREETIGEKPRRSSKGRKTRRTTTRKATSKKRTKAVEEAAKAREEGAKD
ncbi:peptidylprolyl isomerase [Thermococcus sp.]|uniref:FKBP-type peptidyl-prolyl cis-trans isomerase n=1 Tax=Thermococcus sp. TaxID=35749 RepID=UPI0025FEB679|nr:peptidylprolyl isomerase [Thermococcus sp.]